MCVVWLFWVGGLGFVMRVMGIMRRYKGKEAEYGLVRCPLVLLPFRSLLFFMFLDFSSVRFFWDFQWCQENGTEIDSFLSRYSSSSAELSKYPTDLCLTLILLLLCHDSIHTTPNQFKLQQTYYDETLFSFRL